jgi:hypothetical protein
VIKNEAPTRFRAVLSCGRIKITTGVLPVFTSQEPSVGRCVCVYQRVLDLSGAPPASRMSSLIESTWPIGDSPDR